MRSHSSRFDDVIGGAKLLSETVGAKGTLEGRDIQVWGYRKVGRGGSIHWIRRVPHIHHEFARVAVRSEGLDTRRISAKKRYPANAEAAGGGGEFPNASESWAAMAVAATVMSSVKALPVRMFFSTGFRTLRFRSYST